MNTEAGNTTATQTAPPVATTDTDVLAIAPETAERLAAQAAASGLSVDGFLRSLLGMNGAPSAPEVSLEEFMADWESFAEDVPPLPPDFSREDIYFPER